MTTVLKGLIFHDNNKCITANGQRIINVNTDKMLLDDYLLCAKNLEVHTVPLRCNVALARHSFARLSKLVTLLSTIECRKFTRVEPSVELQITSLEYRFTRLARGLD